MSILADISKNTTQIGSTGVYLQLTRTVYKDGFLSLSKSKGILKLDSFPVLYRWMFHDDHEGSVMNGILGYIDKKGIWKPNVNTILSWLGELRFSDKTVEKEYRLLHSQLENSRQSYLVDPNNNEKALCFLANMQLLIPSIPIFIELDDSCKDTSKKQSLVYLMGNKDAGYLKIGYSTDVGQRFCDLQKCLPFDLKILKTKAGDFDTEQETLSKFEHLRLRGEWFKWDDEIIEGF